MRAILFSRLTLVWLALVAATVISWGMGHGIGFHDTAKAAVAILAVAAIKVRFVIFEFMELRNAPRFMRCTADGWIIVVWSMMIALYFGLAQ